MDKAASTTTSRTFGGAKPPADVRLAATSKTSGRPSAAATLSWAAVPDWRLQGRVRFDASRGLQREIRGGWRTQSRRRFEAASGPRVRRELVETEDLAADDNEARDRRGDATRRRAPGDDFGDATRWHAADATSWPVLGAPGARSRGTPR